MAGMQFTQLSCWARRALRSGGLLASGLVALALLSGFAHADEGTTAKAEEPHQIVREATEKLFQAVKDHNGGQEDPQAYYAEVERILEPVVDFAFIARVVMGDHSKSASAEQIEKFAEVFKKGLVQSYAKGIATYIDSDIDIVPPSGDLGDKSRVTVRQNVKHEGSTHQLHYTMALSKRTGEWKLINLVLDGVNLGKSFRSQFAQAASKHDGDIDKVIATWLDEV